MWYTPDAIPRSNHVNNLNQTAASSFAGGGPPHRLGLNGLPAHDPAARERAKERKNEN
jgi:hypothetical protein